MGIIISHDRKTNIWSGLQSFVLSCYRLLSKYAFIYCSYKKYIADYIESNKIKTKSSIKGTLRLR